MELRQLATFKIVATLLNFNRAAEVLHYAQSTVSAQIKALEESLGVPLFERLGRQVTLTAAGQVLLRYAEKMLALQAETEAQINGMERSGGLISVRAPQSIGTYCLPRAIQSFGQKFPRVGLEINSCAYHELRRELKSGITDVAFLLAETVSAKELHCEALAVVRIVLAAAADHPLAAYPQIGLEHLKEHTLLLPKHDCAYKMVFEQLLNENKAFPLRTIEFNSIEAIKECLYRRIGVALLPEMAVKEEITTRKLSELPWDGNHLESAVLMIWHKDKWLSPALESFMKSCRRSISQNLFLSGTLKGRS